MSRWSWTWDNRLGVGQVKLNRYADFGGRAACLLVAVSSCSGLGSTAKETRSDDEWYDCLCPLLVRKVLVCKELYHQPLLNANSINNHGAKTEQN